MKHDVFHFHKKLKEITNIFRASISKTTKNNKSLTDPKEISRVREEYIRNDACSETPSCISSNALGLPVMKSKAILGIFST
jgi:hypothetical protein